MTSVQMQSYPGTNQDDIEAQTFKSYDRSFNDSYNPRLGFVRKVYGIITAQLFLTTLFVIASQGSFGRWLHTSPAAIPLFWMATIGAIATMLMVTCSKDMARQVPTNYIILGVFTLCESYTVAMVTSWYNSSDVILAAALTLSLTVVLTIYAMTTKTDFTIYGGLLCVLGWGLFAISVFLCMFSFGNSQTMRTINILVSIAAVCIYGVYLIYDTELLVGGHKHQLSMDDYVVGAMMIYIDIIVLFVRILRIIGSSRRSS